MPKLLLALTTLVFSLQLSGCGQKGPLFIPEDPEAAAAEAAAMATSLEAATDAAAEDKKKKPAN